MKTRLFAVALALVLAVLLLPGAVFAQGEGVVNEIASPVYIGSRQVGEFRVQYFGQEEFLTGDWLSATLDMPTAKSKEVYFRIGGGSWNKYNFHDFNWGLRFGYFTRLEGFQCEWLVVNVMWRDISDGKIHYADAVLRLLPVSVEIPVDIRGGYFSTYSPDYRLAVLKDPGRQSLEVLIPETDSCSNYTLLLNGQVMSAFYEPPVDPWGGNRLCHAPMYGMTGYVWVNGGEVVLEVSPRPVKVFFQTSEGFPGFLNLSIYKPGTGWCGGRLAP